MARKATPAPEAKATDADKAALDDEHDDKHKEPTKAEDAAAIKAAREAGKAADNARAEGHYEKAAQIEREAQAEGNSVLGKDAVVVQAEYGVPVVARRGDPEPLKSSATNPALMANDPPKNTPLHGNTASGSRPTG